MNDTMQMDEEVQAALIGAQEWLTRAMRYAMQGDHAMTLSAAKWGIYAQARLIEHLAGSDSELGVTVMRALDKLVTDKGEVIPQEVAL